MPSYRARLQIGDLLPGHRPEEVMDLAEAAVQATHVLAAKDIEVVARVPRIVLRFTVPGSHRAGEDAEAAVYRRAEAELGLAPGDVASLELVLPDFRYRAVDASGTVENEICPVYLAILAEGAELGPNLDEVAEYAWADPAGLIAAVDSTPFAFSPWLVEELAGDPLRSRLAGT